MTTNWSSRETVYSELSVSLGQVTIFQTGVRQGVSSGSDEQVGSTSQSTVPQSNTDKDEMEEVVTSSWTKEGEGEGEWLTEDEGEERHRGGG